VGGDVIPVGQAHPELPNIAPESGPG